MTLDGTVVNGVVVFDGSRTLAEGTRVRVEVEGADTDEWPGGLASPTDSYEEHLTKLRQSIADAEAGVGLVSLADFAAELKLEYGESPTEVGPS